MRQARAKAGADWFAQVKAWGVPDVAARFGLELVRAGADVSFVCPACGKATRHKGDRRRSAKVTPDGGGWWCEPCEAKGDAMTLAAVKVTGTTKPTPDGWRQVRQECAALGLCEADSSDPRAPRQVRYVPPARPVVVEQAPSRLPAAEVAALWAACPRLDAVPDWEIPAGWCGEVRAYLVGRGLDVGALAMKDAARVVPPAERVKAWPEWWRGWWGKTWRLVAPLYDATGAMVALQARALPEHQAAYAAEVAERLASNPEAKVKPATKTTNPSAWRLGLAGVTSGTVFASAEGLDLLRGTYTGPGLVIVEGLTDYLAAVQLVAFLNPSKRPAVWGVIAGSDKGLTRARPNVLRVNVFTDGDDPGDKYEVKLVDALHLDPRRDARVTMKTKAGERMDVNDLVRAGRELALRTLTQGMEVGL